MVNETDRLSSVGPAAEFCIRDQGEIKINKEQVSFRPLSIWIFDFFFMI